MFTLNLHGHYYYGTVVAFDLPTHHTTTGVTVTSCINAHFLSIHKLNWDPFCKDATEVNNHVYCVLLMKLVCR